MFIVRSLWRESMAKAMTSSTMTASSQIWRTLPWLLILFLLSFTGFLNLVASSATQPSYHDHCSLLVPSSSPKKVPLKSLPFARSHDGYYTGGQPVLDANPSVGRSTFSNSISLRTLTAYDTNVSGLFKLDVRLTLPNADKYSPKGDFSYSPLRSVSFDLEGFWSESKGKLCMVGSDSTNNSQGNFLSLAVVLKLYNLTSTTNIPSLITGTLESLSSTNDPNHFDPISILILPQMNYKYTAVSKGLDNGYTGGTDLPRGLSLRSFPKNRFCSINSRFNQFNLRYARECVSAKNCGPFNGGNEYVPRIMSLNNIECSVETGRMRVLLEFSNGTFLSRYRSFNPQTSVVGEGSWDESKRQLRIVACPILGVTGSFTSARLGNCSMRLTLLFPLIWSIKDASDIVGRIWTSKTTNESGFFPGIMLRSSSSSLARSPALKYEYTHVDMARRLCPKLEKPASTKGEIYPCRPVSIMNDSIVNFGIEVKNSTGTIAWAYPRLMTVGTQFYEHAGSEENEGHPDFGSRSPLNISFRMSLHPFYGISLFNTSSRTYEASEIRAEGIYDAETGSLCMVGCRDLVSDGRIPTYESPGCKILVQLHIPSLNSTGGDYIKGSISSIRDKSDPLYFGRLDLSASTNLIHYRYNRSFTQRMDLKTVLVLISPWLSCILVLLRIFHVKGHPKVLLLIFLVMLSVSQWVTLYHLSSI